MEDRRSAGAKRRGRRGLGTVLTPQCGGPSVRRRKFCGDFYMQISTFWSFLVSFFLEGGNILSFQYYYSGGGHRSLVHPLVIDASADCTSHCSAVLLPFCAVCCCVARYVNKLCQGYKTFSKAPREILSSGYVTDTTCLLTHQ